MNCCNESGDCRPGRDCPVRKQAAKVARVGRKDYAREPLPVSASRTYLRHLAKWMLIVLALLLTLAIASGVAHA